MENLNNKKIIELIKIIAENHQSLKKEINNLLDKLIDNSTDTQIDEDIIRESNGKILQEIVVLDELRINLEKDYTNAMSELKKRGLI